MRPCLGWSASLRSVGPTGACGLQVARSAVAVTGTAKSSEEHSEYAETEAEMHETKSLYRVERLERNRWLPAVVRPLAEIEEAMDGSFKA